MDIVSGPNRCSNMARVLVCSCARGAIKPPQCRRARLAKEPNRRLTDDKELGTPTRVVGRKVDEILEGTALPHRVRSGPLRELELGDPLVRLKVVGPRRVVTGGKRGTTLHDLVGLEQRGEQQGDGACVDEVVEPTQLSPGGHGRREQLTMDADCGDLLCSSSPSQPSKARSRSRTATVSGTRSRNARSVATSLRRPSVMSTERTSP